MQNVISKSSIDLSIYNGINMMWRLNENRCFFWFTMVMCTTVFLLSGCERKYIIDDIVYENMSAKKLKTVLGAPDVISESSGDLTRFYRPDEPPVYKWPYYKKNYYYLDRNIQVVTKKGRVVKSSSIDKCLKELWLLPIIKKKSDGQFKRAKLEDFAATKHVCEQVEQEDLGKLSGEAIESAYKDYIEDEGKDLIKATDDQLAKDIVSGSKTIVSPLVSYYRLLLRDERRAKKCISKQVQAIVKEGVGKEHRTTKMLLPLYCDLAVEPLLRIADKGTPEERQIAVGVLRLIPDPIISNKLIGLLDRDDIRKDSITSIAICEIGIRSGNPKAIDFLVDAATSEFMIDEDFEASQLRDKSRQIFMEIFTECIDSPEDWSKESLGEWRKRHCDTVELPRVSVAYLAQRQKEFELQCLLFQEVAKMLEKQRDK